MDPVERDQGAKRGKGRRILHQWGGELPDQASGLHESTWVCILNRETSVWPLVWYAQNNCCTQLRLEFPTGLSHDTHHVLRKELVRDTCSKTLT